MWLEPITPEPPISTWAYDARTTLFRQSLATHFEAPFIPLVIGGDRALLIDTGTGDVDLRAAVDAAGIKELVVAHSHAHSDHVGGDFQFEGRAKTSTIGHTPAKVKDELSLDSDGLGSIDLGGRILDIFTIPGHEVSHIAFYDRNTKLLFTGDTLYPGRLYIRDWKAYITSVKRLVDFVDDGHPVSHVLGSHIEISADNIEYAEGSQAPRANEHRLPLGVHVLRDLRNTLESMAAPTRVARPSYVVVPLV